MLRNVVVHINNEQPIIVDLVAEPVPSDVALLCKNVRTINGKKPVFIDRVDSTFLMPLAAIRFVEIHRESVEAHQAELAAEAAHADKEAAHADKVDRPGTEFPGYALARVDLDHDADAVLEPPADVPDGDSTGDGTDPDGLDDDLLRRIREA
jgi:hypothetical protein